MISQYNIIMIHLKVKAILMEKTNISIIKRGWWFFRYNLVYNVPILKFSLSFNFANFNFFLKFALLITVKIFILIYTQCRGYPGIIPEKFFPQVKNHFYIIILTCLLNTSWLIIMRYWNEVVWRKNMVSSVRRSSIFHNCLY